LKGLDLTGENNVQGIVVENSILWCDRARIFLLGHESRAAFMRQVTFRNLDILHFSMTPFLLEPGEDMRLATLAVTEMSQVRVGPLVADYHKALHPAERAVVDAPQNSKIHELISLALFALGNYRAAAGEAHAAMALGPIAGWNDLFAYYHDARKELFNLLQQFLAGTDPFIQGQVLKAKAYQAAVPAKVSIRPIDAEERTANRRHAISFRCGSSCRP
jgi:hypothetical protein